MGRDGAAVRPLVATWLSAGVEAGHLEGRSVTFGAGSTPRARSHRSRAHRPCATRHTRNTHTHATGLANPGPIITELWTDEELEAAVTLDGVVTLVDARNISRQLAETRPGGQACEAQLQVALADVILLNKVCVVGGCEAAAAVAVFLWQRLCFALPSHRGW